MTHGKYFSTVEKKCVDSLTPLISTGVTLNHLLGLCCRGRWGARPHGSQSGKCSVGSMGLWVGVRVTSIPQRLEEASQHCCVHSGPVECSGPRPQCLLPPDWGSTRCAATARIPMMSMRPRTTDTSWCPPSSFSGAVLGSPFKVHSK